MPAHDAPWTFQRDEIDVMEDEIDELYRQYQMLPANSMEHEVLHDVLDMEEHAEAELATTIKLAWLKPSAEHAQMQKMEPEKHTSTHIHRPPLYRAMRIWAKELSEKARGWYELGEPFAQPAFRVHIQATMIPVKYGVAFGEEEVGQPLAQAVALKEYKLAERHLERVVEALHQLIALGQEEVTPFLSPAAHFFAVIRQQIERNESTTR